MIVKFKKKKNYNIIICIILCHNRYYYYRVSMFTLMYYNYYADFDRSSNLEKTYSEEILQICLVNTNMCKFD